MLDAAATRALRESDPQVLEAGIVQLLEQHEQTWLRDSRDLLLALAPYHDCAGRLGLDQTAVFDAAAELGPASLRETVRAFGRRRDVTTAAFGFSVEETPEGPRYRFAWPS